MKVSRTTQALSIGLMATMLLPGFMPAIAADEKPSANSDARKDDKKPAEPEAKSQEYPGTPVASPPIKILTGPFSQVDGRIVRTERRIVEDVETGRLSPVESDEFHKALDHITEIEAQFRQEPGKFTRWQNVRLNYLLDKLSDAIDRSELDRDVASVDLQFTRDDLWHRIDLSARQGRLTPHEVADLKQRFNRINALVSMLQKNQGRLSYVDKLMLSVDYDHLGEMLSRHLSEKPVAMPDFIAAAGGIEKRLADGVKDGKLTENQAQEFKKSLAELRTRAGALKNSAAAANDEQIIALGLDMDALANKIEAGIEQKTVTQDIDARLKLLDHRMAATLDEGSLSSLEAYELKEDLDAIAAAKEKLSVAGGLKPEDEAALKLDVARLEGRLDRQLHGPSRIWPGITVSITHLSDRIKNSNKAKRISDDEAKSIKHDLIELNIKKAGYEKAEGGITIAQALPLAQELQQLAGRLEMSMKDRDMEVPNLDGLRQAIDNRVGEATVSGQLDEGDARTAVLALNQVNSVKEKYHASDNELTPREKFAVAFELERLSERMEEKIHEHAPEFPGLDTRRNQIESLVNEGISSGRITDLNADFYKQKLAENSKLEKEYRANTIGLTGDKALELVSSLEQLWSQLDRELREKRVATSDLVSMEGNVEKKIREGFSSGLLAAGEAEALRATYDAVVASFRKMRADDGGLSYGERLGFLYGFERLTALVERSLHSSPIVLPSLEDQRVAIEQKLSNLLATGHLSLTETQDLKALLDEISRSAAEKRASGGGMSYQEILLVSIDMDRLAQRIEQRAATLKHPLPDVDAQEIDLEKKLEEAKSKGAINAAEYKEYKAELARIATNEAAYRISDESLDYAETINLMLEIERLKGKLEASRKVSAPVQHKKAGG